MPVEERARWMWDLRFDCDFVGREELVGHSNSWI